MKPERIDEFCEERRWWWVMLYVSVVMICELILFQCGCISWRTGVWVVMPVWMIGRLEIFAHTHGLDFIGDWVVSWRGGKKRSGRTHLMNWERSVIDRSDWLRIKMVGDRMGCDVSIRCLNVAECYWVLLLTWRGEWSTRV
jgi:hypothetical protein